MGPSRPSVVVDFSPMRSADFGARSLKRDGLTWLRPYRRPRSNRRLSGSCWVPALAQRRRSLRRFGGTSGLGNSRARSIDCFRLRVELLVSQGQPSCTDSKYMPRAERVSRPVARDDQVASRGVLAPPAHRTLPGVATVQPGISAIGYPRSMGHQFDGPTMLKPSRWSRP